MKYLFILSIIIILFSSCTKYVYVYYPISNIGLQSGGLNPKNQLHIDTAINEKVMYFNDYMMPEYQFPKLKNTLLFEPNFTIKRNDSLYLIRGIN
jgi:hypothetical protein